MTGARKPKGTAPRRVGWLAKLLLAVAIVLPVAAGLFRVWVNQDAVQIGYRLSTEMKRRHRLQGQAQELEVELTAERSPERLKRLAAKHGLAPPPPERIFGVNHRRGGSRGP